MRSVRNTSTPASPRKLDNLIDSDKATAELAQWREQAGKWIDTIVPGRNRRLQHKTLARICEVWSKHCKLKKKHPSRGLSAYPTYWHDLGASHMEAYAMSRVRSNPLDIRSFISEVTAELIKVDGTVPLVFQGALGDFRDNSLDQLFWRRAVAREDTKEAPNNHKNQYSIVIGTDCLELRNVRYLRDIHLCRSPQEMILRGILREFFDDFPWSMNEEYRLHKSDMNRAFDLIMSNELLRQKLTDVEKRQITISSEQVEWDFSLKSNGAMSPHLKTQSGDSLSGQIARLGTDPVFYLHETTLYRCNNDWIVDSGFATDNIPEIDQSLLNSKKLLKFVRKNDLKFEGRHLDEIEFRAANARFTCWLEKTSNGQQQNDHERLCLRAYALNEEGAEVCVRTDKGWQNVIRSEDQITAIYTSSSLTELDQQLHALPGSLQYESTRQLFWTPIDESFQEMFIQWYEGKPDGIEINVEGELTSLANRNNKVQLSFDFRSSGIDWFDVALCTDKNDLAFSPTEILSLLSASRQTTLRKRISGKGWVELDSDEVQAAHKQAVELGMTLPEVLNSEGKVHVLNLASKADSIRGLSTKTIRMAQGRVDKIFKNKDISPPRGFHAELRSYQQEGFKFLSFLSESNLGGILADDMGLGKTVQTIAWLASLKGKTKYRSSFRALILCPKSVIDVWLHEIARFAPALARLLITDIEAVESVEGSFIGIFGYTRARLNQEVLQAIKWSAVILDEAQAIKNPESLVAQAIFELESDHRLALTGTPVENRLLDLWSIMNFAQPGALGPVNNFQKKGLGDEIEAATYVRAKIRPFMLRRTKAQVLPDLPACVQEDILCEMNQKQTLLYRAELKRAQRLLVLLKKGGKDGAKARFQILVILTRLRQIACHPGLVDDSFARKPSSKVTAALDILTPVIESGNSVVVFSQFLGMLRFMENEIDKLNIKSYMLTGATERRGDLVKKFTHNEEPSVFLISLKAGGSGLNLTKASHVVLLDPWWNPAVEQQAIDRLHRIGQRQGVNAYRILAKNTVEERVRQLQLQKAELFKAVVDEGTFSTALTASDFEVLLGG